jgi:hypothetical protein
MQDVNGTGRILMASEALVRKFFEISKRGEHYFALGQEILIGAADIVESEISAEETEKIGTEFAEYMLVEYMERFSDTEMLELLAIHEKSVMLKFINTDRDLQIPMQKYLAKRSGDIIGHDVDFEGPSTATIRTLN